jgi:hypothetical protein
MARKEASGRLDDVPTLGARALMNAIDELALRKCIAGYRLAYKMNDRGEHVVALIYPPQPDRAGPPPAAGEAGGSRRE